MNQMSFSATMTPCGPTSSTLTLTSMTPGALVPSAPAHLSGVSASTPAAPERRTHRASERALRGRRDKRRVPHRVPCLVHVVDGAGLCVQSLCGQTVNLSADGLALRLSEAIAEGAQIQAVVPRNSGPSLEVMGTVVHSRRVLTDTFEIGIHLTRED